MSPRFPTLFRVSAHLTEAVRIGPLTAALQDTWARYPLFRVRLRRGVFWHYLEECAPAPPEPDDGIPCTDFPRFSRRTPLVRVFVRGRRIAVEASHALTDGTGVLEFLRTLLVAYALRGGVPAADAEDLRRAARELGIGIPGDPPDESQGEYASRKYYERRLPEPREFAPAWHAGGPRMRPGEYRVTTLRYPTADLKQIAGSLGVSVTDLALAVFVDVLQRRYHAAPPRRRHRRPIRILIPVNMRPHTGSRTMRNFFVYVMVELDQRLGVYSLEEIAGSVHHQLRAELDPRSLRRQISRNVRAERNVLIRVIPIALKDVILRTVHRVQGESVNTASLSNLGRVQLPASVAAHVAALDFVPPASPVTGINMTLVSIGGVSSITFGSTRRNHDIEREVATAFHRLGADGDLRTNWRRTTGVA